ncbi:serine/threonine-protein kinase [Mycobacterium sp. Z3061]|uniref:serine/threonine-protein kinase n=1 Tax=Mycobacterium sp. Z3061 TaxID=3073562 RepID=UPI002877D7E2|nr:serine/threonine-protein kinase [Mycobacterium sp. Z3061]
MPLENGERVADYSIVGWLGAGPLGDVYRASHPTSPHQVALKIPFTTTSQDRAFRMRFQREGSVALQITHPNLVRLHDIGDFDGRVWAARDYVDGTSAAELIAQHYPQGMPEREVCAIVDAVADPLDHLHRSGCLHRSVKPTNILVTPQRRILLSDFGTSSQLATTAPELATLPYLAPESATGADGPLADQYALAANAFYLLTGAPPPPLAARPARLSDHRPELSHLDQLFAKALSPQPNSRFRSCREFAAELTASAN